MMYQKVGKKMFRYDEKRSIVEYVDKATPDMYEDDKEWMEKHGHPLWGIDSDGYIVLDSAGLSREHWNDKEARIEYLTEWSWEISEEVDYLVKEYVEYEAV